jgi:hypothetical protein
MSKLVALANSNPIVIGATGPNRKTINTHPFGGSFRSKFMAPPTIATGTVICVKPEAEYTQKSFNQRRRISAWAFHRFSVGQYSCARASLPPSPRKTAKTCAAHRSRMVKSDKSQLVTPNAD